MKAKSWIFTVRYAVPGSRDFGRKDRFAVVGPARASTVEAALHLGSIPERLRAQIRECQLVRDFVEGKLDPDRNGYYMDSPARSEPHEESWALCVGSVHEVIES